MFKMDSLSASLQGGGVRDLNLQLHATVSTNPYTLTITKAYSIAATVVSSKGTLLSSNGTFTVPSGVSYVSINALYEESWDSKGSTVTDYGCAAKRIKVTPGTTYTINSTKTGYDKGYDYMAGFMIYYSHATLGNVPSPYNSTWYKVYTDTESGTLYVDSNVRARYNELTGGTIPS